MTLEKIARDFASGVVKNQNLEGVIFTEYCASDPARVAEAGRLAAGIRCGFLEEKTGKSLPGIKAGVVDNCTLADGVVLSGIESKKIGRAHV